MKILIPKIFTVMGICVPLFAQSPIFSDDSILEVSQTEALVCTDLNADQTPDLAIAVRDDVSGNHIAIYMNNGNGIFNPLPDSIYFTSDFGRGISHGDFNNDQIPDLATSIYNDSTVVLFLGNGDGSFSHFDTLKATSKCEDVFVADLNLDQVDDLIVTTRAAELLILKGQGAGAFDEAVAYAVGGTAGEIEVYDMNNDQFPDILVGVSSGPSLPLFWNDGEGGFSEKQTIYTFRPPWFVTAAHFNSDSYPDLVVGSGSYDSDNVMMLLGDSQQSYTLADTSGSDYVRHIDIGDLNDDGNFDVLIGDKHGIYWVACTESGSFTTRDTIDFLADDYRTRVTHLADLDGDERPDLLIARDSHVSIYYNTPDPTPIADIHRSPEQFKLYQNYPNPFNPVTVIRFNLSYPGQTRLTVQNILGQEVATLIDQPLEIGEHIVNFNASTLASGVYFYRLEAGDMIDVKKMFVLK